MKSRTANPAIAKLVRAAALAHQTPRQPQAFFALPHCKPAPARDSDLVARARRLDAATRWQIATPHHHKPVFIGDDSSTVIEHLYDRIKSLFRRA